jgi:hypothetical protein
VAQALQLGADGVAAMTEPACNLTRAVALGPESLEQCYVVRIPTHKNNYTPNVGEKRVIADDTTTDTSSRR